MLVASHEHAATAPAAAPAAAPMPHYALFLM